MPLAGRGRFTEFPVACHRVEELVVDGRNQDAGQFARQFRQFSAQIFTARAQPKKLGDLTLNGLDVRSQRAGVVANTTVALLVLFFPTLAHQDRQLRFEGPPLLGDLGGNPGKVLTCRSGSQTRGSRNQSAALLCNPESGCYLRDAAFVDTTLNIAHAIERQPTDQTRDHGEGDGASDPQIELRRDSEAALEQPIQRIVHGSVSRSVSTG